MISMSDSNKDISNQIIFDTTESKSKHISIADEENFDQFPQLLRCYNIILLNLVCIISTFHPEKQNFTTFL